MKAVYITGDKAVLNQQENTMEEYRWAIAAHNGERVRELQESASITRPTALVLATRGIGPAEAPDFLNPSLSNLVDPYELPGCEEAAARLWKAVRDGESILIHGDYDADGITAAVLVSKILSRNGAKVEAFLPHRIDDGYGLTAESIDKACTEKHSLLITVDCGITSYEAVEAARKQGIDVIITDHHEPGDREPVATAVIDPKLPGSHPRVKELAGVGVAFKLCHAFIKYGRQHRLGGFDTDLKEVLDLVALGTVADIVPLLDENRCLAKFGLQVLSRQHRPGIRALCELVGLNEAIRSTDIAYRIAPRLNAPGRMGDPMLSLHLLEAESMGEAVPLARALDNENKKRQQLEAETFERAEEQIRQNCNLAEDRAIVVWGDNWHQGVLGIVAARLTRRHHRPCIVLTRDNNGLLSGSGRSVTGVNLVDVLERSQEYLDRFGGHPMAAGLSLEPEYAGDFSKAFIANVRDVLSEEAMRPELEICGEISFRDVDEVFLEELHMLEPFGQGNPQPVFFTRGVTAERLLPAGTNHTRGALRDANGNFIDFIAFGRTPDTFPPPPWDVAHIPKMNTYGGRRTPQIQILDVRSIFG